MKNEALIVRDDGQLTVEFTGNANALRTDALERSGLICRVNDAASQANAVEAQQALAGVLSQVEKARKAAKEPVLEFGRRIDDAAKGFIADLKAEQLRVATLVADYQQLEQARVRAAEQVRLAEARKLEEERRALEQAAIRAAEIERQRIENGRREIERKAELNRQRLVEEQAKIARAAAEVKNKADRERLAKMQAEADAKAKEEAAKAEVARLELDRQQKLSEAKSHEQLDRINEQHAQAVADLPVAAPVRTEGQRVREEWAITVSDIWLLAKAHPVCVRIEPRLSEIKNLLDAGVKVAGVIAKREIKAGVSTSRRPSFIEIGGRDPDDMMP